MKQRTLTTVFLIIIVILTYKACELVNNNVKYQSDLQLLYSQLTNNNTELKQLHSENEAHKSYNDYLSVHLIEEKQRHELIETELNNEIDNLQTKLKELREIEVSSPEIQNLRKEYEDLLQINEDKLKSEQFINDSLNNLLLRSNISLNQIFKLKSEIVKLLFSIDSNLYYFNSQSNKAEIIHHMDLQAQLLEGKLNGIYKILEDRVTDFDWTSTLKNELEGIKSQLNLKQIIINEYDKKINLVYCYVGSTNELINEGLIKEIKKNGFFSRKTIDYLEIENGISKVDTSKCLKYDRRSNEIIIPVSKKIIKIHPNISSENFIISGVQNEPNERKIKILNKSTFWSHKLIVIQTE